MRGTEDGGREGGTEGGKERTREAERCGRRIRERFDSPGAPWGFSCILLIFPKVRGGSPAVYVVRSSVYSSVVHLCDAGVYVYECVCADLDDITVLIAPTKSLSFSRWSYPSFGHFSSLLLSFSHTREKDNPRLALSLSDMCTHAARPMILSPSLVSFLFLPRVNISPRPPPSL